MREVMRLDGKIASARGISGGSGRTDIIGSASIPWPSLAAREREREPELRTMRDVRSVSAIAAITGFEKSSFASRIYRDPKEVLRQEINGGRRMLDRHNSIPLVSDSGRREEGPKQAMSQLDPNSDELFFSPPPTPQAKGSEG